MADLDIKKINCQFCNATLGIPIKDITEEGKSFHCPRCHKSFFIQKSQFEKFFEYSMHCPKCGEFQKASEECIICHVIINKFLKYKELNPAWDTLSARFVSKNPESEETGPLNPLQDLIIKCPYCGFSKTLSKDECPGFITRIGCPDCDHSFDIVAYMHI